MIHSILYVEDDTNLAESMTYALEAEGYRVAVANTVEIALATVDLIALDVALLDVNIGSDLVFPVAAALQSLGVPFVFVSGANVNDFPKEWRSNRLVVKPYGLADIRKALCEAAE